MSERKHGDKLMPRIIDSVVRSVIATKVGLMDADHKVRVMATKSSADIIGHELAELMQPFLSPLIEEGKLPDPVHEVISKIASGEQQYQAIAGMAFGLSGVPNVLSTIMGNYLAPLSRLYVAAAPSLAPDTSTIAGLFARGLISEEDYQYNLNAQGLSNYWAEALQWAAYSWPDFTTLQSMVNRQLISQDEADKIMRIAGIPEGLAAPFRELVTNVLSPADAALAVLRSDMTLEQGRKVAHQNGITDADFDTIMSNTGEPPGAQELMQALRRDLIDEATFKAGIRQSRIRNQWVNTMLELRYSPLSTADAVNAHVEGYMPESEVKAVADQNGLEPEAYKTLILAAGDPLSYTDMMRLWRYGKATRDDVTAALKRGRLKDDYIDFALALKDEPMSTADAIEASVQGYMSKDDARVIAGKNGLTADDFDALWLTAGSPLSKTEMITLWRRGEVTEEQVKDAMRQSRMKDSYVDLAVKLKEQLPALYMVNDLLGTGGLSAAEGTRLLLQQGYGEDIVKRIVAYATGKKTSKVKQLTESMYADLYMEQAITAEQFDQDLLSLGYTKAETELIREVYDQRIAVGARNATLSNIRTAYVTRRISEGSAQTELNQIGIPAAMVTRLIDDWDIEVKNDVKILTAAQVVDAWQLKLFDADNPQDNAQAALEYLSNLGYSTNDAVMLLEIKNKGTLGGTGES